MTRQPKHWMLLSLVAILAYTVLALAYPRFMSSLSYIPVEAALDRHWKDYPIKQKQFPVLIGTAESAIRQLDMARYWQGLAWLHFLQAMVLNADSIEGQQSLALSQKAFETFLTKSPANPAAWLRLAWIHELLNHEVTSVVKTLKMSFYTGRAERHLFLNRLDLALRYAKHFEYDDLSLIQDQIQLAWRFFESDTLRYIQSGVFDRQTLLDLIVDSDPELSEEIQDKL